jgi:hypothetical protein
MDELGTSWVVWTRSSRPGFGEKAQPAGSAPSSCRTGPRARALDESELVPHA